MDQIKFSLFKKPFSLPHSLKLQLHPE